MSQGHTTNLHDERWELLERLIIETKAQIIIRFAICTEQQIIASVACPSVFRISLFGEWVN